MQDKDTLIRVDFSLRREVFVVVGAIVGALVMIIPKTILEVGMGFPYYLTWIALGHIVGIYSPAKDKYLPSFTILVLNRTSDKKYVERHFTVITGY